MGEKEKNKYDMKWIYARTKGNRKYLVCLILAGMVSAAANIGMADVLKRFVDIAMDDSRWGLSWNIGAALLLLGIEGTVRLITEMSYRVSSNGIGRKIRLELAHCLYHSNLQEMQNHHTGEYMTNLTGDVEKVSECFPGLLRNTVGNGLAAVLAVLYLFLINWKLALILLICIPLLILCIAVFSPVLQRSSRIDKEREEDVRVRLQEMLDKMALFKIGGMWKKLERQLEELLTKKVQSARRLGAVEGGAVFINNIMGTSMFLIAMAGGAYFVMQGEMRVGDMIAVVQLSNYIVWPFTIIGEIISNVNQSIVSVGRLQRICSLGQEPEPKTAPQKEAVCLKLEKVSFAYGTIPVLEEVNAEFGKQGITGITGESGGGKSTLLKIMAGLYIPGKGSTKVIFTDGSIWESVRPYIGLVPSSNLIFRDTIEANICMAAEPDRERMIRCAEMANISRYIEEQEHQYETKIGDGLQMLSSGQEQRIGIARALYQGAQILLFDEPTANLDAESTEVFLDTLEQITPEKICIVATHDAKVMERCGRMFEIKEGRLHESGNF